MFIQNLSLLNSLNLLRQNKINIYYNHITITKWTGTDNLTPVLLVTDAHYENITCF